MSVLTAPLASFAQQQPAKFAWIGFLGSTTAFSRASRVEALREGLRDLGYVEGKNLVIEFRWAEGKYERLCDLAADQAPKFEVLINMKTAKALGIKFPNSILLRADKVIE